MGNKTVTPVVPVAYTAPTPEKSNSVKSPNQSATDRKSTHSPITSESPKNAIPLPVKKTFDKTATNTFKTTSPVTEIPLVSSKSATPIASPKSIIPIAPVNSSSRSTNDTLDKSSNLNFTVSPDVSTIFPTVDTPTSPNHQATISPVNTNNPPVKLHSGTGHANNVQASDKISTMSKASIPTEVGLKRSTSKVSEKSSTIAISKQKSIDLSLNGRTNRSEQETPIRQHHNLPHEIPKTPKPDAYKSKWTDSYFDQREVSAIKHIVPVPTFTLRSTAVCNHKQQNLILERGQSNATDISLFKFYLDPKETQTSTGSHTKATMFNMDTVHKQTPFPKPSISFCIKNFNDGFEEVDTNSAALPTFRSLGLEYDFETEVADVSSTKPNSNDKKRQQIPHTPSFTKGNENVHVSPLIDANQQTVRVQDNYQGTTSIFKKPTNQINNNSISAQNNYSNIYQNNQNLNNDKYRSTVSFNVSPLPRTMNRTTVRGENIHGD